MPGTYKTLRSVEIEHVLASSDVINPYAGQMIWLAPGGPFLYWTGTAWATVIGGGGGGTISISDEGVLIDAAMTALNVTGGGKVTNTGVGTDVLNIPGATFGTLAGRPGGTDATNRQLYFATDVGIAYISDGTAVWQALTWTIAESQVTNLVSDLAAKLGATAAVGGDLAGNLPNPTLAAIGAATGPLGTASRTVTLSIDTKGRTTVLTDQAIAIGAGAVSGLAPVATSGSASDLSSGTLAVGRLPALTGDATEAIGTGVTVVVGLHLTVLNKAANYTILATDSVIFASTPITLTLPSASVAGVAGKVYTVKKVDTATTTIIVNTTSNQTIDGETFTTLNDPYESFDFISDGANWFII